MVWKDIDRKMGMALEQDVPSAAGRFSAGNGDYSALVRGNTGHGSNGSGSGSDNGVYNSKGPGSILNQPVFDSQQRIKEASSRLKTEKDQETRSVVLNELREEQEFLKNLLGMQLELNTLGYKMAKAFAQALGQIVIQ
jgi:hypothetical protein